MTGTGFLPLAASGEAEVDESISHWVMYLARGVIRKHVFAFHWQHSPSSRKCTSDSFWLTLSMKWSVIFLLCVITPCIDGEYASGAMTLSVHSPTSCCLSGTLGDRAYLAKAACERNPHLSICNKQVEEIPRELHFDQMSNAFARLTQSNKALIYFPLIFFHKLLARLRLHSYSTLHRKQ